MTKCNREVSRAKVLDLLDKLSKQKDETSISAANLIRNIIGIANTIEANGCVLSAGYDLIGDIFCPSFLENGENRMKWEYKAVTMTPLGEGVPLSEALNEYGRQKWELVQCDLPENLFIFKRPKPEPEFTEREIRKSIEGYFGRKIG